VRFIARGQRIQKNLIISRARLEGLDRAILFAAILGASLYFLSLIKLVFDVSFLWVLVPIMLTMPFFIFYAQSIKSNMEEEVVQAPERSVALSSRLAKVKRVVHGHTHFETHRILEGVELLNSGTWSPGFEDYECTRPFGRKPFVWIKPAPDAKSRTAELREWKDPVSQIIAPK